VTQRRDANRRLYRAAPEALGSLQVVLREMWAQDLDRLRRVVEDR
jgi:hypothetical protein